jgi:hypothetical protein
MANQSKKIVGFRNKIDGEWKTEDTPKVNITNGYEYLMVILEGSFADNLWTPEVTRPKTPPPADVLKQLKPGVLMLDDGK